MVEAALHARCRLGHGKKRGDAFGERGGTRRGIRDAVERVREAGEIVDQRGPRADLDRDGRLLEMSRDTDDGARLGQCASPAPERLSRASSSASVGAPCARKPTGMRAVARGKLLARFVARAPGATERARREPQQKFAPVEGEAGERGPERQGSESMPENVASGEVALGAFRPDLRLLASSARDEARHVVPERLETSRVEVGVTRDPVSGPGSAPSEPNFPTTSRWSATVAWISSPHTWELVGTSPSLSRADGSSW